jgi:dienelactone hydrolase
MRISLAALALLACAPGAAAPPELARTASRPLERHAGLVTRYGALDMGGYRVRTITTGPLDRPGRHPAVLFVQWLSCDTVELGAGDTSGWSQVIRGLVETPGLIVTRTEKPGVGDSEGPACAVLDYETELAVHRRALDALLADPKVDPARVHVVGMSMGATMAPLLAEGRPLAGVAIWGGGARPWRERQLAFERNAMTLRGLPASEIEARTARIAAFYDLYLGEGLDPEAIARRRPDLAGLWGTQLVGTEGASHFGRPFAFHRQAAARDWAAAWSRVRAPVLVMLGEYDWFEQRASAELAVQRARAAGNRAEFVLLPGTDHHFTLYPDPRAAFREEGGRPDPGPALAALRAFLAAPRP